MPSPLPTPPPTAPVLDRLHLYAEVRGEDDRRVHFEECLSTPAFKPTPVEGIEHQAWIGATPTTDMPGECRILIDECVKHEGHDQHAILEYRRGWTPDTDAEGGATLPDLVKCFSELGDFDGSIIVETSLVYPSSGFVSILDSRRDALAGGELDSSIRLTGVELDFSGSSLPLHSLRITERRNRFYLLMEMSVSFEPDENWYDSIESATNEVGDLFTRPVAESDAIPESPENG